MQWYALRNFAGNRFTDRPLVAEVSSGLPDTLGLHPKYGRTLNIRDELPGHALVAMLSAALARKAFGSEEAALGKPVKLDGLPYTVSGILPVQFHLDVLPTPEILIPLAVSSSLPRDRRDLLVIGRLRDGVTSAQGLADLESVARGIAAEHPDTNTGFGAMIAELNGAFIAESTRTWLMLSLAFSGFILLIACANVATLQLMRSVIREREFAVREALGANRFAMFRQAIAESACLATAGAVMGIAVAFGGIQVLQAVVLPTLMEHDSKISISPWSIAFAVAAALCATFLFGLVPGSFSSKLSLEFVLRSSGRGTSGGPGTRRRIALLTSFEVALAFLLLFSVGLFAVSSWRLQTLPLGFNPSHIVAVQVELSGQKYEERQQDVIFYQKAVERAEMMPSVQEFALSSGLPLRGGPDLHFHRTDRPRPANGREPFAISRAITPNYFHLLGIPIIKGRQFSDTDKAESPPVVIINQNFAWHFFPNENPVGKQLVVHGRGLPGGETKMEIAGVAGNVKDLGIDEVPFDDLYLPLSQNPGKQVYTIAKSPVPESVGPALRRALQAIDPEQFVA